MWVDLKPLQNAIEEHGMKEKWGRGGLFELTDEEVQERVAEKTKEAQYSYTSMMKSPKNDKSVKYRMWAINTALEVRTVNKNRFKTKSYIR